MLNFFVLGLIPGTALQITFNWFLVAGIIADVSFGVFYIYVITHKADLYAGTNKLVPKGDQLALFN